MPPKKKRAVARTSVASRPHRSTRQSTRNKRNTTDNDVPDVYQEMLEEAAADDSDHFLPSPRPVKRRKVSIDPIPKVDDLFDSPSPPPPVVVAEEARGVSTPPSRPQQIIYDDFEGSSEESDVEFEDVELESDAQVAAEDEPVEQKSLQIDLSKSALESARPIVQRRKPVTKAERSMRLDVHKWHLLSLIGHGLHRNDWCNREEVHSILKPLVPRKIIKLLHVDESKPLYERNYSFNKGVEEISLLWHHRWKTIVQGLRKAYWREGVDALTESDEGEDLDFDDFKDAARTCRGSRDLGAQLFTALLRSIAVEARLVFSLQVLPFTGAGKVETPVKPKTNPNYINAPPQNYGVAGSNSSPFAPPTARPKKSKKIIDSPYPTFWTEILTPNKTWTPLDPVVRNTISKPKTQFEPSLSDNLNSMTYVIAYEDDNSAHDVTRRYTQWFNAKTRKMRVESTKSGEQWYNSALSVLSKKLREPRDEIEADELAKRINSEGMPHNIQDFKNHPVYVLERHMRANEVLQPKREVGKINVGTAKNGKIEPVYRRQDVHLCRTADAWYRRGRDVKMGEQPLKRVIPKARRGLRGPSAELSDDENEEMTDGVGLYTEFQTNMYEPPPVVNGRIPKNAYGNLDVYVPSMIPPGALHISHPLAATAAKLIGIDFADAVTGFEFKGRQGTAVVNGVVIAEQYTAAVAAVIGGLEALGSEEVQEARSRIVLGIWKRMLQALRVRERIEAEYGTTNGGKGKEAKNLVGNSDDEDEDGSAYEDEDAGGGFMLEAEQTEEKTQEQAVNVQILKAKMPTLLPDEVISVPINVTRSPHKPPTEQNGLPETGNHNGNDDLFEEEADDVDMAGGGFVAEDSKPNLQGEEGGGGFIIDNNEDVSAGAGGFFPEPTTSTLTNDNALHSDVEEDSALQLAIAESLMAPRTPSPIPAKPSIAVTDVNAGKERKEDEKSKDGSRSPGSSLLSHDPNEDDEEPEWLNEALDE